MRRVSLIACAWIGVVLVSGSAAGQTRAEVLEARLAERLQEQRGRLSDGRIPSLLERRLRARPCLSRSAWGGPGYGPTLGAPGGYGWEELV